MENVEIPMKCKEIFYIPIDKSSFSAYNQSKKEKGRSSQ